MINIFKDKGVKIYETSLIALNCVILSFDFPPICSFIKLYINGSLVLLPLHPHPPPFFTGVSTAFLSNIVVSI